MPLRWRINEEPLKGNSCEKCKLFCRFTERLKEESHLNLLTNFVFIKRKIGMYLKGKNVHLVWRLVLLQEYGDIFNNSGEG